MKTPRKAVGQIFNGNTTQGENPNAGRFNPNNISSWYLGIDISTSNNLPVYSNPPENSTRTNSQDGAILGTGVLRPRD